MSDGAVTIALPAKSLRPGTHQITLEYAGDAAHEASSGVVQVVVKKVKPKLAIKAPKSVKQGARAKVTVTLSAPDKVAVTGKVRLKINGGKTLTGTIKNGKVTFKLPKAKKANVRVTVTYLGSDLADKVVKSAGIKVKRKR